MVLCKEAGAKRAMRLNVSGAFHSPLMESAADGLAEALDEASFERSALPGLLERERGARHHGHRGAKALLLDQLVEPGALDRRDCGDRGPFPERALRRDGSRNGARGSREEDRAAREDRAVRNGRRRASSFSELGRRVKIDLSGASALVTGSTRGIGRAIAETLAGAGARVAVVGPRPGRARSSGRGDLAAMRAGFACDVGDVGGGHGARRRCREGVRRARHPREQRRPHARQPPAAPQGRRLGRRARREPARRLRRDSRRDARHDEAALGTDHQHRERGRDSSATRGRRTTRRARRA